MLLKVGVICHLLHTLGLRSADVTLNRPLRWITAPSEVSSTVLKKELKIMQPLLCLFSEYISTTPARYEKTVMIVITTTRNGDKHT